MTQRTLNSQTISLLQAARNVDPIAAYGGGNIRIVDDSALVPELGPSGTLADIEPVASSNQISVYIVREGDTISQIAEMFGVSPNTVRWANNIVSKSHISPGQTLIILPITGVQHTIAKGDTLSTIAEEYDADESEILEYNELASAALLSVGDTLMIPDGAFGIGENDHSGSASHAAVKGAGGPSYTCYYIHPLPGSVRTQGLHGYNAVDFGASYGAAIRAAAPGTVIISRGGWNGGYGDYIVVEHPNGTQTLYSHMSDRIVGSGTGVVQGQVIGYVGSSGRSTGPHLHFEIRGARNPF